MNFNYVAYTQDMKLVKGTLSATTEEAANDLLNYGGYRLVSLKAVRPFLDKDKLLGRFYRIKPAEIVMFSRQLALLLESGTDIVTALDLLHGQATNQTLKGIISRIASDIRGGNSLSTAMSKHPRAFSTMYHRAIAAGEQGGNLEVVLRQMAAHIEKAALTEKKVKNALTYPFIVVIVAIVVIGILVTFVLPSFTGLYVQFGAELPAATRALIAVTDWFNDYGLYVLLAILALAAAGYLYIKTPSGRYWWDKMSLSLPAVGRILQLDELSRCCRTMSLLIRVGLPLPEVVAMSIHGSNNKFVAQNLSEVQQELIRGEGLSKPMQRREIFLPMMMQMVRVGEETGNLDNTLSTVADSFELEAADKTSSAVGLIQPAMTIIIGLVIGFIVLAMLSAMYAVYGQVSL